MESVNFEILLNEPGLFVPPTGPGNPFLEVWRDGSKVSGGSSRTIKLLADVVALALLK